MRSIILLVHVSWIVLAFTAHVAAAESVARTVMLRADDAIERGRVVNVQKNAAGDGAILSDSTLIEDDGPGIGPDADFLDANLKAPVNILGGEIRLKKVLNIARPEAMAVYLYAPKEVNVEINGVRLKSPATGKYRKVPPELIKRGDNEVVLFAPPRSHYPVKIAQRSAILKNAPDRKDQPPRSYQSVDGGKTWKAIDGEAMVRLHLVQYAAEGSLVSPVIDLGHHDGELISSNSASTESVNLKRDADLPKGTSLEMLVRTGTTPVYDSETWGQWQVTHAAIPAGQSYLQWKAVLKTTDPTATPTLRKISVEAKVKNADTPAWASHISKLELQNPEPRYTSIPFEYEDPFHPRLVALRRKYKLDDVVAGAYSETEKLIKLRSWVSKQWKFKPPVDGKYPAWDADEILQGKRGFCVQYAIVYMQCCISLGYQARFVFGDQPGTIAAGHEICEVWSNEHRKWILMDPNNDEHYVDPATGIPLSMLETHDRLLQTFYPNGKVATFDNRPRKPAHSPLIAICKGPSLTPDAIYKAGDPPPAEWDNWTKWLNVRYMPRNNFFAHPTPAPIAQGFHWDWTGYYIWHDAQTPMEWHYRNFIQRRADVNWTINEVRFAPRYAAKEGTLDMQMGSVTPYFQTYLINIDGGGWKTSDANFAWPLHPGANRLEMRVRNTSGVEGPISSMHLNYNANP
jgi:hypothetical protein